MEERTRTSSGLGGGVSPPALLPPFLPKRTPNTTAMAITGAIARAIRVPRRFSTSIGDVFGYLLPSDVVKTEDT